MKTRQNWTWNQMRKLSCNPRQVRITIVNLLYELSSCHASFILLLFHHSVKHSFYVDSLQCNLDNLQNGRIKDQFIIVCKVGNADII